SKTRPQLPFCLAPLISLTKHYRDKTLTGLEGPFAGNLPMSFDPKHLSHIITNGRDRAPARSMLKAIGFTDEDLAKPIIGVAHMWIETMPCNFNHRDLAVKVKQGIRASGCTPMEFNTISISDGVTMGTEGMKASLISRDLIADSIEL